MKEGSTMESNTPVKLGKYNPLRLFRAIGPAVIIAASIVGPGTVTTASKTGADWKYMLLWTMVFTPFLAYLFEEPAIRYTLSQKETLFEGIRNKVSKGAAIFSFIAIFIGCVAYQSGNYMGAAMALNFLAPSLSIQVGVTILSVFAVGMAMIGRYKFLERINMILVGTMTLAFVITMFAAKPDVGELALGLIPRIPKGAEILALGLVATTMCPDIPFALSSLTKERWSGVADMKPAVTDLRLNMMITAFIGCSVMICAGTVIHPQGIEIKSAADMAAQLVPLLGSFAGIFFALGLWAAGFSSALYMTACIPQMMNEAFGWEQNKSSLATRICVVLIGIIPVVISILFGSMPVTVIVMAQALNAILLPITIFFIAYLCNRKDLLQEHANNKLQNLGLAVVAIVVALVTITSIPSIISGITGLFS